MTSNLTGDEKVEYSVKDHNDKQIEVTESKLIVDSTTGTYGSSIKLPEILKIKKTRPNTPNKIDEILAAGTSLILSIIAGGLATNLYLEQGGILGTSILGIVSIAFLLLGANGIKHILNKDYSQLDSLTGVKVYCKDVNGVYFELHDEELRELITAMDKHSTTKISIEE